MKLVNIPKYLDENVVKYINSLIQTTSEDDFSEDTFAEWLAKVDVENKNNPSGYLRSCFKKELDKGTFKPKAIVNYVPSVQPLINELRNKGIVVLADDTSWLKIVWEHIVNFKEINLNIVEPLNRKIVASVKTFAEYKEKLINAEELKPYDINWKLLEERVKIEILGWNKYLDELEKLESEG